MSIPYDVFVGAFLAKVQEYEFCQMFDDERTEIVDGYLRSALANFKKNCKYDFATTGDNLLREFDVTVPEEDLDEIVDIVSEGMLVYWMKPYLYRQELLENLISTRDYSVFSPAELLHRVGNAANNAQKNFTQKIREYSYNHGELSSLHI